ncbi:MAG TPA: sigma factor-like helix-turn-helix DNA-binding protein [Terracidiphilus sp.]|nr:sigma factor-like helix-turn-helix DNA-binding protein [Terracidiphilus sp.]
MSAAFQLPMEWEPSNADAGLQIEPRRGKRQTEARQELGLEKHGYKPPESLAFYRKHTESLLRRYLYASTQVGRAPSILGDPVGRGWASSRPVKTFEDALIFVLDIETCLEELEFLDRELISRVVLQDYTHEETAAMLGVALRTIGYRVPLALDRLTEKLLAADLLMMPL